MLPATVQFRIFGESSATVDEENEETGQGGTRGLRSLSLGHVYAIVNLRAYTCAHGGTR